MSARRTLLAPAPLLGFGPGFPARGAIPFTAPDRRVWIQRQDGAFECIAAPLPRALGLHEVVDPRLDPAAWRALAALCGDAVAVPGLARAA